MHVAGGARHLLDEQRLLDRPQLVRVRRLGVGRLPLLLERLRRELAEQTLQLVDLLVGPRALASHLARVGTSSFEPADVRPGALELATLHHQSGRHRLQLITE